jgi:hypothetical protein
LGSFGRFLGGFIGQHLWRRALVAKEYSVEKDPPGTPLMATPPETRHSANHAARIRQAPVNAFGRASETFRGNASALARNHHSLLAKK